MKYEFTGRDLEISDKLKETSIKKLERLNKRFSPDTKVYVTYRSENKDAVVEVSIPVKNAAPIRTEVRDRDKYTALDLAVDKLERQVDRYRKKLQDRGKTDKTFASEYFAETPADTAEELPIIRRIKKVPVKPMEAEEACLQMELLGHNFFVFRNITNQQINVVYKRLEPGTYGLIEVEE